MTEGIKYMNDAIIISLQFQCNNNMEKNEKKNSKKKPCPKNFNKIQKNGYEEIIGKIQNKKQQIL